MSEYATLLSESVLRERAWLAEHPGHAAAQPARAAPSDLLASISHELRTPLNTMIGFAKLLGEHRRRPLQDAEIVEYAGLIGAAAGDLLAVVNDLLDISRMQCGRYALDAREVALDEVLQVTLASLEGGAREAGVALASELDPSLPAVRGDAGKLRQVFTTLVGSAIRSSPRGGKVTVEAHALSNGGVLARVCDAGPGMSRDEIAAALAPFAQVNAGHSRKRIGTGLGLPIAKALVQLHGGRLDIESAGGTGVAVSVMLPGAACLPVPPQDPRVRARQQAQ